jgi:hypothetical protein
VGNPKVVNGVGTGNYWQRRRKQREGPNEQCPNPEAYTPVSNKSLGNTKFYDGNADCIIIPLLIGLIHIVIARFAVFYIRRMATAKTVAKTAAELPTLRRMAALSGFPDVVEEDAPNVMLGFTLEGTCRPSLVRLTGAGATDGVKLVLRPGRISTPWPPAPMADWLAGAVNGT